MALHRRRAEFRAARDRDRDEAPVAGYVPSLVKHNQYVIRQEIIDLPMQDPTEKDAFFEENAGIGADMIRAAMEAQRVLRHRGHRTMLAALLERASTRRAHTEVVRHYHEVIGEVKVSEVYAGLVNGRQNVRDGDDLNVMSGTGYRRQRELLTAVRSRGGTPKK